MSIRKRSIKVCVLIFLIIALSKISIAQRRVGAQARRIAFHHLATKLQHIGAPGKIECLVRVLLDQEDGQSALAIELPDKPEDLVAEV